MRSAATISTQLDPYRAGLELADGLAAAEPEAVILFASIHYGQSSELLDGLYDGLDNENLLVVGNSGDGCYGPGGNQDIGVSALGLNGDGKLTWHLQTASGLAADPTGTAVRCFEPMRELECDLAFFGMDFRCDASAVLNGIQQAVDIPVIGGAAGDDYHMQTSVQFANREVLQDSVVSLGIAGPIRYAVRVAHSLHSVGSVGTIEDADNCTIRTIDGQPALTWLQKQVGRPYLEIDMGVLCMRVEDHNGDEQLRSLMPSSDHKTGEVRLYGHIESGSQITCCIAEIGDLEASVRAVGEQLDTLGFSPSAAIVVSCAGRKRLLGSVIDNEVTTLTERHPDLAITGYPSFGEFGPVSRGDNTLSRCLFHNMSYILLCLGS